MIARVPSASLSLFLAQHDVNIATEVGLVGARLASY